MRMSAFLRPVPIDWVHRGGAKQSGVLDLRVFDPDKSPRRASLRGQAQSPTYPAVHLFVIGLARAAVAVISFPVRYQPSTGQGDDTSGPPMLAEKRHQKKWPPGKRGRAAMVCCTSTTAAFLRQRSLTQPLFCILAAEGVDQADLCYGLCLDESAALLEKVPVTEILAEFEPCLQPAR